MSRVTVSPLRNLHTECMQLGRSLDIAPESLPPEVTDLSEQRIVYAPLSRWVTVDDSITLTQHEVADDTGEPNRLSVAHIYLVLPETEVGVQGLILPPKASSHTCDLLPSTPNTDIARRFMLDPVANNTDQPTLAVSAGVHGQFPLPMDRLLVSIAPSTEPQQDVWQALTSMVTLDTVTEDVVVTVPEIGAVHASRGRIREQPSEGESSRPIFSETTDITIVQFAPDSRGHLVTHAHLSSLPNRPVQTYYLTPQSNDRRGNRTQYLEHYQRRRDAGPGTKLAGQEQIDVLCTFGRDILRAAGVA